MEFQMFRLQTNLFQHHPDATALIFASNVFGYNQNNKVWNELESNLEPRSFTRIRDAGRYHYFSSLNLKSTNNYIGEMPLNHSFIIRTNHPEVKYIVYVGSYLSTLSTHLSSPYSILSSALLTIRLSFSSPRIQILLGHNRLNPQEKISHVISKG